MFLSGRRQSEKASHCEILTMDPWKRQTYGDSNKIPDCLEEEKVEQMK